MYTVKDTVAYYTRPHEEISAISEMGVGAMMRRMVYNTGSCSMDEQLMCCRSDTGLEEDFKLRMSAREGGGRHFHADALGDRVVPRR